MKAVIAFLILIATACSPASVPEDAGGARDTLVAGFPLPLSLFAVHESMDSMGIILLENRDERIEISAGTCSPNEVGLLLQEKGWSIQDSCRSMDEKIFRATFTGTTGHGSYLIRLSQQGSRLFPGKYACSILKQTSQGPTPPQTVMILDSVFARLCRTAP